MTIFESPNLSPTNRKKNQNQSFDATPLTASTNMLLASTTSGSTSNIRPNFSLNHGSSTLKNVLPPVYEDQPDKKYPRASGSFEDTLDFKSNSN